MNKLKMESLDMTKANIDKIAEMFPQVVTEVADPTGEVDENGKVKIVKAIDFEKLKLVLSAGTGDYVVADDERERYEFTWVGKRQAMIDAATPIRKTLRPCPKESKDWATTENLYIEGDNLEVLKLLQESYLGKVKMIYIDPPYNTGKDFIYKDKFSITKEEEEEAIGMYDDDDYRLFQNTETNGRFHSDWCSMIYPRLQLARNLLTDDGVIFISIDDNEVENLKKMGNEIFGENNFVGNIIWQSRTSISNDYEISTNHNHTLVFSKNRNLLSFGGEDIDGNDYINPDNDIRGPWKLVPIDANHIGGATYYPIINPKTGKEYLPPNGRIWAYNKETYQKLLEDGRIKFGINDDTSPKRKLYYNERIEKGDKKTPSSILLDAGSTKSGTSEIMSLFDNKKIFDYPKPSSLLERFVKYGLVRTGDIVLDFFSGSATTAHAVMQLNAEDGGNRKFIMVQLSEVCDPNSEAAKAGYKTICEIGKERIRRAGEKIDKERIDQVYKQAEKDGVVVDLASLDTGFRVFKLDTTNMKDVYYAAGQLSQKDLWDTVSNIKDDRSDIDLLYGCLLDWGVQLTMSHTTEQMEAFTVHTVDSPLTDEVDLIACFDSEVSETVVRTIAKRKPTRALFRDSSFADSANKINVFEIFKSISPDTTVKVI